MSAPFLQLFGIWRYDANNHVGDWLRESENDVARNGIVAYPSRTAAFARASTLYGYPSYSAAKADGWVEVRPLISRDGAK